MLAVLGIFGASAQEPSASPTFRTGVSLVHVDVQATLADGRVLGDLQKADFRVFDNSREQSIVEFAAEEQALDLILLFDISGSMKFVVREVSDAAHDAFQALKRGDRVSVMVFNTRASVISPFSDDLGEAERAIRDKVLTMSFGGGTYIQEAVDDAALRFLNEPRTERRRAVLIVTDNLGTRTRRVDSVVQDFWEADAILSGLIVNNRKETALLGVSVILNPTMLAMQAGMTAIAQKTGGDAMRAEDPASAFEKAIRRIRTRYSLYYAMPAGKPGSKRTIRVELSRDAAKRNPSSKIRARTGYIVP
jgi:VWFA-related protein